MKRSFFLMTFLVLLCSIVIGSLAQQEASAKTIDAGSFMIRPPDGKDWTETIDRESGSVQFQRVIRNPADPKMPLSSASIQVIRTGAPTEQWDLGENEMAESYLRKEEKSAKESFDALTKQELKDLKKGTTTIGGKKLHFMSYKGTGPEVTVEAVIYLHFPADYKKNHVFYVFFFSDAFTKGLHTPNPKEIHPVIAGLKIKDPAFPMSSLSKELLEAVNENKSEKAKQLLARGANANATNSDGWSALMVAASKGHSGIVSLLLEKGARVNEKNPKGQTPVMFASHWGHAGVVKLLIDGGADVNAPMANGWTPLIDAVQMERPAVVKLLIEAGADVKGKTRDGWTALMAAAYTNQTEVAGLLIDKDADVNAADFRGMTALRIAKSRGYTGMVELIEKAGGKE